MTRFESSPSRSPLALLGPVLMVFLVSVAVGFGLARADVVSASPSPVATPQPSLLPQSVTPASPAAATAAPSAAATRAPAPSAAPARPTQTTRPTVAGGPTMAYPQVREWQVATLTKGPAGARAVAVMVETGLAIDPNQAAETVLATLNDHRGWAGKGHPVRLVADARTADLVIHVATPQSTDRYCYPLHTDGRVSCTPSLHAIYLNSDRWLTGVPHVPDLGVYRRYLISHEFGHSVGMKHVPCPGVGRPAPVMLQQTLHLNGCTPNEWITVA